MDWTDRLTLLVDAVTKGAAKDLKGLQGDLAKTDAAATKSTGVTGKLTDAWGFLKSSGVAAGVGLATVGKVVGDSLAKFTSLGKEATNMADALGLTTEQASRWIAVADDYQVSTEAITKGLLAVEKSAAAGGDAIETAGGQIVRARDGSVDVNATMESVADGLNAIKDPATRAAAAAGVFGKNWGAIAPLMVQGGKAIDTAMRSVSNAQTITAGEADEAERMRLAQDALSDALGDLELMLGEVVAQLAPLVEGAAQVVEWYGRAVEAVHGFEQRLGPLGDVLKGLTEPFGFVGQALSFFGGKAKDTKKPVDQLAGSMDGAADAADNMDAAYRAMTGALDQESALLRAKDAFDDLREATAAAHHAGVEGSAASIEANRKMQQSVIATKQDVIRYAQALGGIPPEKVTEILALIDRGDYMNAAHQMDQLARDRTATVNVQVQGLQRLLSLGGLFPAVRVTGANGASPSSANGASSSAAAGALGVGAPTGFGAPAAAAYSPTLVVQINAPSIGNPTHISDAVVAGYNRALRLSGPRAVTVPTSGLPWTS